MIIISCGVSTIQECEAHALRSPHPKTLRGLLSLHFIAVIPHLAIPSPIHLCSQGLQSSYRLIQPPGSMGRVSSTRGSRVGRQAPWSLGLLGFPEKHSGHPWPGALSHRPVFVWSA